MVREVFPVSLVVVVSMRRDAKVLIWKVRVFRMIERGKDCIREAVERDI